MKIALCVISSCLVFMFDVIGMDQRPRGIVGGIDKEFFQREWELQTSSVTHFTEVELQTIFSETSADKAKFSIPEAADALIPHVLEGNPNALFGLAQRDGGMARLKYNGEKQKLLFERGILLLIAVVKGDHYNSRESLDNITATPIDYSALKTLEDVKEKAIELIPSL